MRILVGPYRLQGARSQAGNAPMTAGVLWKNEEGNVVSMRQAHALFVVTPKKRLPERGHVLRSVQRPVHVNRASRKTLAADGASRRSCGVARRL